MVFAMAYIRDRKEELTLYQEAAPLIGETDFGLDIACVYGVDPGMPDRVKKFRERGYRIHLMTGIAWGSGHDYFFGKWDGQDHTDELQHSRDGSLTGEDIHWDGYYVPTLNYLKFLVERLKVAVDAGVEAIHVEEPEFLNAAGYSEGFKREYKLYYHEDWVAPHENVDAFYKAAKLKAYLYRRAIERVSQDLRDYAMNKYGRVLRFYVPTHSLLNYSQWKVLSPEGTMTDIPSLDGYKAQVWMGTSREGNVYNGVYKERTFETAFLEYGVMQELVRGTGRDMWFDNDPIEDLPIYTWVNYKQHYLRTLMGELLQPHINTYQCCPWPHRIFSPGVKYPSNDPNAKPMPEEYRTFLANIFQMQGTFGTTDFDYTNKMPDVGVFLSDTAMFQRNFPDDVLARKDEYAPMGEINVRNHFRYDAGNIQMQKIEAGGRLDFYESLAFPLFYGMALPLLKGGLPVRPVQLENVTRYPGYLDNYKMLILSYEFMKPLTADVNTALANYVSEGGMLVYVGDGLDPFHNVRSWWNTGKNKYPTALEHLLTVMGIPTDAPDGVYGFGKGKFMLIKTSPADLCVKKDLAADYRNKVSELLDIPLDKNYISLRRGEYYLTAVMDECEDESPFVHKGNFVDMLDIDFKPVKEKVVEIGESSILYDLDFIKDKEYEIIGTSIRATAFESDSDGFRFEGTGAVCNAAIRLKLPKAPKSVSAKIDAIEPRDGNEGIRDVDISFEWDEDSSTVLLKFKNIAGKTYIEGKY